MDTYAYATAPPINVSAAPAEAASTVAGTTATVVNESPITAASTKDLIFLFIFEPLIVSQNKRVLFSSYLSK